MKKNIINYQTFNQLDIVVGKIIKAHELENSQKLLLLTVNLGEDWGTAEILAGIKQWYKPKQLIGNNYLFCANLEPKMMMGHQSCGMIMAADVNGKAVLIKTSKKLAPGTVIR